MAELVRNEDSLAFKRGYFKDGNHIWLAEPDNSEA
jgi:hypothetical protein